MPNLIIPCATRTADVDRQLREELTHSLEYLATFLGTEDWFGPDEKQQTLSASPVSPWVFGIYAIIAQHASRGELDAARHAFDSLATELTRSPPETIVAMSDPRLAESNWQTVRLLLDTDPDRTFQPRPPTDLEFQNCSQEIVIALALLDSLDTEFAAEINLLLRLIILAVPAGSDRDQGFNGASTFFLWGATTLNAQTRRGVIDTLALLVHEASHLLLFGLVSGGALSLNDPGRRYPSPLRTDPRPIDGIFHAAFVATRVHLAMTRLRSRDRLPPEFLTEVEQCARQNMRAAKAGLDTLQQELHPTPAGLAVLDALVDYWGTAARAA